MAEYKNTYKIINDPIYGLIHITDANILRIIDHPFFQRLRRIKQMGMAEYVYPGAVHSRFQHSIGATHLMAQALEILIRKGNIINNQELTSAQYAILLHDIGHGPFSHALEYSIIKNTNHEAVTLAVMQSLNHELEGLLSTSIDIFSNSYHRPFFHQLMSGQLDMDRMDYLNRDSFYSGVSEGVIGYDRILQMLQVYNEELVVEEKGIHSIEKFIIARRLMYWQVYLHKTVISTEQLLIQILRRAKTLAEEGKQLFASEDFSFFLYENIQHQDLNLQEIIKRYMNIDDSDIIISIKYWSRHSDFILSTLCQSLLNRRLYKTKLYKESQEEMIASIRKENNNISEEAFSYFVVNGITDNNTYSKKGNVQILFKNDTIKDISEVDNALINSSIGKSVKKHFVGYLPDVIKLPLALQ